MPPEGIEMGIDGYDEGNEWRRAVMDDYYALVEYQQYYEPPKSEEEMNRMLESWGLKIDKFTKEIIVPPELNLKPLGNNNYRGALPQNFNDYKALKESGITTVLAATPRSGIRKLVEANGMEFIDFVAKSYDDSAGSAYIFSGSAFKDEDLFIHSKKIDLMSYSKYDKCYSDPEYINKSLNSSREKFREQSRDFIDKLTKAVSSWQRGCCFIGCTFGTKITTDAITVINIFNPKGDIDNGRKLKEMEMIDLFNLYKKLTPEDKKLMAWTKEFENSFVKRFGHTKLF